MTAGKRALVTGATGFTGGHMCRYLRARGYDVRALVRPYRDVSALRAAGVTTIEGELGTPASLGDAVRETDVVFHIAAAFRDASLSEQAFFDVNVQGTENLIRAAADAGVGRFVHCSTIGVHGDTGRTPATEESPFRAPDAYCRSKIEGELLARRLFKELGIAGTVFRPMGIYGPGDTRFLKLFKSIRRGRFVMIGSGKIFYQMTYVEDLCSGILMCGERPEAVGEVFILAGSTHTTLNDLVECIRQAVDGRVPGIHVPYGPVMASAHICKALCRPLGLHPPLYPRRVAFFGKDRAADISKARQVLGYEPEVSLAEGVRRTAAWYFENGWL